MSWVSDEAVAAAHQARMENIGTEFRGEAAYRVLLAAALPIMLRDFLWSDEARDVTGSWGHDNVSGDEFRNQLMDALASGQEDGS